MQIEDYLTQIVLPKQDSHKGQNGRVLVIGGSKLFHASAFWAASMASSLVDLVHFSSPAMENNDLMRVRAKEKFWDGIVVPWEDIDHYIEEDDVILIGPGMPRDEGLMEGEKPTAGIVNSLLTSYSAKKWVVDGGALQEVDVRLLNMNMIVTPNRREVEILGGKLDILTDQPNTVSSSIAQKLNGVTVLAKGQVDTVSNGVETVEIPGGNAGMTKGGTGDVLAGLVAGLYALSPAFPAAVAASFVNKKAAETISSQKGTFFSASDLIHSVQNTLGSILS
jgi:NAD(P)H-hydrate epimerase